MYGGIPRSAAIGAADVQHLRTERLECARLVAVFSNGEGDQVAQTDRLFRFVKEGRR